MDLSIQNQNFDSRCPNRADGPCDVFNSKARAESSSLPSWKPEKIQECHFHIFLWWCHKPAVTMSSPQLLSPRRPPGVKTKAVLVPSVEGRGVKNTTGWWKCTRSLLTTEDDHISSSYLWQTERKNFLTICFTLGQDILSSGKDLHTHTHNEYLPILW